MILLEQHRIRTNYRKLDLKAAVEELVEKKLSLRVISLKYGIPKTTLGHYRKRYIDDGFRFEDGFIQDEETLAAYLSLPGFSPKITLNNLSKFDKTTKFESKSKISKAKPITREVKVEITEEDKDNNDFEEHFPEVTDPISNELGICRFCMKSLIEDGIEISHKIRDQFNKLMGFQLNTSMNHPRFVCNECNIQLLSIDQFKSKILECQERIEKLVNGQETSFNLKKYDINSSNNLNLYDEVDTMTDQVMESVFIKIEPEEIKSKIDLQIPTEIFSELVPIDPELLKNESEEKPVKKKTNVERPKQKSRSASQRTIKPVSKFTTTFKIPNNNKHKKRFLCDLCGFRQHTSALLDRHMLHYHLKIVKCDHCERTFKHTSALDSHTKIAHQLGSFQCTKCPKKFQHVLLLRNHFKKNHTAKVICELCGELVVAIFMQDHKDSKHANVKCEHCGKVYNSKHTLRTHINSIHTIDVKTCDICNEQLQNQRKLTRHKLLFHRDIKFVCPFEGCDYSKCVRPPFKKHLLKHKVFDEKERKKIMLSMQPVKAN